MSPAQGIVLDLAAFARRWQPRCLCWLVDGLREEHGDLECATCGSKIVTLARVAA